MKKDDWESYILAIERHREELLSGILTLWALIIEGAVKAQVDDHGYQVVIDKLNALCDVFLYTCLSGLASSAMDIEHVQHLYTLYQEEAAYREADFLVHMNSPPSLPDSLHFKPLSIPMNRIINEAATYTIFQRCMSNPNTSRKFYASPQVRHGRIAGIYLQVSAKKPLGQPWGGPHHTSWIYHLIRTQPGEGEIIAHLKCIRAAGLYPDEYRFAVALKVVDWLGVRASHQELPADLLETWEQTAIDVITSEFHVIIKDPSNYALHPRMRKVFERTQQRRTDKGKSTFDGEWPYTGSLRFWWDMPEEDEVDKDE